MYKKRAFGGIYRTKKPRLSSNLLYFYSKSYACGEFGHRKSTSGKNLADDDCLAFIHHLVVDLVEMVSGAELRA